MRLLLSQVRIISHESDLMRHKLCHTFLYQSNILAITDVDIELVTNLPPSKNSDDEPKLPDEDVEESEVQEVGQTQEQTPEEDEIVPIDVKKGNLERNFL